jgi:hypothetical protein
MRYIYEHLKVAEPSADSSRMPFFQTTAGHEIAWHPAPCPASVAGPNDRRPQGRDLGMSVQKSVTLMARESRRLVRCNSAGMRLRAFQPLSPRQLTLTSAKARMFRHLKNASSMGAKVNPARRNYLLRVGSVGGFVIPPTE